MYGSAYDMGYAHGQLLKDQIHDVVPKFMSSLEKEIESYIKYLPKDLQAIIAKEGLTAALEATYLLTKSVPLITKVN